jgi:hypothetical protein
MIKKFNKYFEEKDIQNLQDTSAYIKDENAKYVKTTEPLELVQITGILSEEEVEKIEENIFSDIKNSIQTFTNKTNYNDSKLEEFITNINNELEEYYAIYYTEPTIQNKIKINKILSNIYFNAEQNNTMKITKNDISKLTTLYDLENKNIISDIIIYVYHNIRKKYKMKIDENMTIDKNLNVCEVKRGQIIWLTALLKKPGSSYSNQTLGVLKLRVIDYYYGLNKLNQVLK